jgi:UDP-N-acetylglucosamine 1-carboxyvinyltransferase
MRIFRSLGILSASIFLLGVAASLIIAAIIAEGRSEVHGVENVLKGYENFEEKLRVLGARITRVD